tara:strand:- start:45 stop:245 length:201 start_codon:yes stop_codon:yes gene_type:complete
MKVASSLLPEVCRQDQSCRENLEPQVRDREHAPTREQDGIAANDWANIAPDHDKNTASFDKFGKPA